MRQSPILIEYGQPLFVWLSRDWPSVRMYASTDCMGGVGETIKRKGGVPQACLGKSTSFTLNINNMINWRLSKQDSHWPVSQDHRRQIVFLLALSGDVSLSFLSHIQLVSLALMLQGTCGSHSERPVRLFCRTLHSAFRTNYKFTRISTYWTGLFIVRPTCNFFPVCPIELETKRTLCIDAPEKALTVSIPHLSFFQMRDVTFLPFPTICEQCKGNFLWGLSTDNANSQFY